ncbi:hypothetical protein TrLO_g914 [Triparma laevis f. longispina]|uniref:Uncharacterized protein n=1 Tax=Triparma laevis f. longispina TaxID=1714387 RepID=A0A9W7A3M0_9STRA|nr:hypothetical protein TrLO_g914 [Triparma laevis f. longispina]
MVPTLAEVRRMGNMILTKPAPSTFSDAISFAVGRFDIYDDRPYCENGALTIGSTNYCGTSSVPSAGSVTAGQQVTLTSSSYTWALTSGFEICIGDPCVASTSPSDDGSDGNFYYHSEWEKKLEQNKKRLKHYKFKSDV